MGPEAGSIHRRRSAHALVLPTTVSEACDANATLGGSGNTVPLRSMLTRLTLPFNLTGMPAISLPCGTDEEGFPVGLQLAGPVGRDVSLLQVAHVCQGVLKA